MQKKSDNSGKTRNPTFKESEEHDSMHPSSSIKVGNISNFSGKLKIAGRDIVTSKITTNFDTAEVRQLFDQLQEVIDANVETSSANKEDLKADVQKLHNSVTKAAQNNKKVNEGFLARRFHSNARIAPGVLVGLGRLGHGESIYILFAQRH